jgi:hypothetical protein
MTDFKPAVLLSFVAAARNDSAEVARMRLSQGPNEHVSK